MVDGEQCRSVIRHLQRPKTKAQLIYSLLPTPYSLLLTRTTIQFDHSLFRGLGTPDTSGLPDAELVPGEVCQTEEEQKGKGATRQEQGHFANIE
jgi:hypothetical protein